MAEVLSPLHRVVVENIAKEVVSTEQGGEMGIRIGNEYLPLRQVDTWTAAWDEKQWGYSPLAGLYDFREKAATMGQLPTSSKEANMMHFSARSRFDPGEVMFIELARTGPIDAKIDYGTGPMADKAYQRDLAKVRDKVADMMTAMNNSLEYIQVNAMLGQIAWPPKDANGNDIAAAKMPRQFGQMAENFSIDFVATDGTTGDGGYHQQASTLIGIAGAAATQVPWNTLATANALADLYAIFDLIEHRSGLEASQYEVLTQLSVLRAMAAQELVLDNILGEQPRDKVDMQTQEIRDALKTRFGFTMKFYNGKWSYVERDTWRDERPTLNRVPFMPNGTVMINPRPDISKFGEVLSGPAPGDAYLWESGMYSWTQFDRTPPWNRETGVGRWQWPIILRPDVRFRLDAYS